MPSISARIHANALRWCALTDSLPWTVILLNPYLFFCIFPILFCAMQYKYNDYKPLTTILIIAMLGLILSYIVQRTVWYYHMLPAFSMAILILSLAYFMRLSRPYHRLDYFLIGSFSLILFLYLCYFSSPIRTVIVFNPPVFFSFFAVLFAVIFYFTNGINAKNNRAIVLGMILCIILMGYLYSDLVQKSSYYSYQFILTFLLIMISFTLLMLKFFKKNEHILSIILGVLLFSFPCYAVQNIYLKYFFIKQYMGSLVTFMRENAVNKNVYFFTTDIKYVFPIINYAGHVNSLSRFSHFFGLGGIVKQAYLPTNAARNRQKLLDKDFIINMIADDLNSKKPDLIFVDVSKFKPGFTLVHVKHGKVSIQLLPFDYLNYFSQNQNFIKAWKHYRYVSNTEGRLAHWPALSYKFDVYQRI